MLLTTFFLLDAKSLVRQSLTFDEQAHLRYGLQVLTGDTSRFGDSKMPVSVLNALPVAIGARLGIGPFAKWLQDLRMARFVTLLAACLLASLTWRWSVHLNGPWAGVFSFSRHLEAPTCVNISIAGVTMGVAQLMKFACVLLYPLLPLVALLTWIGTNQRRPGAMRVTAHAIIFLILSLVVLGAGYPGTGWGTPISAYSFFGRPES